MSTKYILHGGMMKHRSDSNKAFYKEMLKGVTDPSVLLVYFARGLDEYGYLYNRDKENFAWANPGIEVSFEIADEEEFTEQVKRNSIIFFGGGETQNLVDAVRRSSLDASMLAHKAVAGSSAGAYLISRWYYANSKDEIREGMGWLPIATMAHYGSDPKYDYWLPQERLDVIEKRLQTKVDGGKVVKLPEQEFVVYNQN